MTLSHTSPTLDDLRAEFPPVDLGYVLRVSPGARRTAERYRTERAALDVDNPEAVARLRAIKQRLLALMETAT